MATATSTNTTLPFPVRFYSPTSPSPDSHGRTLTSILSWPDSALEYSHDYIQILFPLPERSPFNPSAPIINEQTFNTFRSSPKLRAQLRIALQRMLKFYGLALTTNEGGADENHINGKSSCQVVRAGNFASASQNWITRFDHNHLRFTRIIRSCRVLGLEDEAQAFFEALTNIAEERKGIISAKSLMFWQRAAERPLGLAPEDEDGEDGKRGMEWLV
ncbi:MAG: hypothetical protein Q9169_002391 [Polycauliona sp. 2 TL-2023]